MTLFWIMGAIMVALALAFVLPPMLRPPAATEQTADTQALNTALFKERLAELETDLADGLIEQARFETARQDLERELLHELGRENPVSAAAGASDGRWMIGVLAVLVPLVTISLYLNYGESRLAGLEHTAANTERPQAAPNAVAAQANEPHPVNKMVEQLVDRLQQTPDDANGWTMLGRSYMVLERYTDAAGAFARAHALVGDTDAGMLAGYAEALALGKGGQLAGKPASLIETALRLEPDNGRALWLMGHYQVQIGNNAAAASHWRRLLGTIQAGSEQATVINQYLAQIGAATAEPAAATAQTSGAAIEVQVSLDPTLTDRASAEDTVFVFARATQGPRMPLAIIRGQVKDLPMTVTLDDSLAMSPTMTLSSAAQVVVGARISRSGNATPQSGDLQGASDALVPGPDVSIRLSINEVVD